MRIPVESVPPAALDAEICRLAASVTSPLAVAGGDGSLRAAADRVAGTGQPLLPVPVGTLNHFARRMGIDGPREAVAAITRGRVVREPVGIVDDQVFLNTATFGFYAGVLRYRNRWRRLLGRWPAAALGFVRAAIQPTEIDFAIVLDGVRIRRSAALLWVGMGRAEFPEASFGSRKEDGNGSITPVLTVVFVRAETRREWLGLLARMIRRLLAGGDPAADLALEVMYARSLVVDPGIPFEATLDGEVFPLDPPVFVAVRPAGLDVLVPDR
jgi:diacylglycerol kinase family enzyme